MRNGWHFKRHFPFKDLVLKPHLFWFFVFLCQALQPKHCISGKQSSAAHTHTLSDSVVRGLRSFYPWNPLGQVASVTVPSALRKLRNLSTNCCVLKKTIIIKENCTRILSLSTHTHTHTTTHGHNQDFCNPCANVCSSISSELTKLPQHVACKHNPSRDLI